MQEKMNLKIQEFSDGKILVSSIENDFGSLKQTHEFKTRKELADYINPQVTAPAAPPYPSSQANMSGLNINAANAMCGGQQFSMSSLNTNQMPGGSQYNPLVYQDAINKAAQKVEEIVAYDKECQTKSPVRPEVELMLNLAIKCGYGGRLDDFPSALLIIQRLTGDHRLKDISNLQDDGK